MGNTIEMEIKKPHAICIPCPFQSHIKSVLQFSKLLYYNGFHITFVNTEFNHNRFRKSRGLDSLSGSLDFQFVTIPDGLPPSDANSSQDVQTVLASVRKNFLGRFRDLVAKINDFGGENMPPVSCIVADGCMPFAATVAEEIGVSFVQIWTVAGFAIQGFRHLASLTAEELSNYTDNRTNQKIDPDSSSVNIVIEALKISDRASAIVIHTYDALEKDLMDDLSSVFSRIYAIGPFQLLLDQIDDPLASVGYNLWVEETECLRWLNSKEPNSVIYVNFGSIVVMTNEQLLEFGWGLANSKYSFLWIIRPDLVSGTAAVLPPEFVTETKERGMVASWCPQEAVLNHPSIGGFVTHCGWGSTLESLSAGVPMLCWPFLGDQPKNCKYICNEWGVGMEIDSNVKSEEIEKLVIELMEGEKGKKMKEKALEWKSMAYEATSPNGSSFINLEKLVNQLKSYI